MTVPLSDARLPSTWLTNCADPSTRLQSPTKKNVGCKVLQFIHTMKIKKMLGHKTLRCTYTATSSRERDELGQELRLRSQFAWTEFAQSLCNLCTVWRPLKQPFYMSRVRRKEGPKTYSRIPRKSDLNSEILKPRQIGGVEQLSRRCREGIEHTRLWTAFLSSKDATVKPTVELQWICTISLFSWTDLKTSTLDLEIWFLEVFKHISNLPKYK